MKKIFISKRVFHDENFSCNLSGNGVARQVAGRLKCVTCLLYNLSWNFFGLAMIAQSKLVLHSAIFLATCLATLEKGKPLQVAEDVLHVAISSCDLQSIQKNSMQSLEIVEPICELYFVQLLQAQKGARQVAKRARYTLQPTCNFLKTPLQRKLQRKLHLVTLAVELDYASCNDCRYFSKSLKVATQSCNQRVTCLLQFAMDLFSNVARQVARKIAPCNTS